MIGKVQRFPGMPNEEFERTHLMPVQGCAEAGFGAGGVNSRQYGPGGGSVNATGPSTLVHLPPGVT